MRKGLLLIALLSVGALGALNMTRLSAAELSLAKANELAARAVDQAKELNIAIAVAIVDQHGNLKAFQRMDGTPLLAVATAQAKAYTAAASSVSTAQLATIVTHDPNNAALAIEGILLIPGGVPIMSGGELIGGIGVAGASGSQDEACANAGFTE